MRRGGGLSGRRLSSVPIPSLVVSIATYKRWPTKMVEGDRETIELPVPFNLKALYFPFSLSLSLFIPSRVPFHLFAQRSRRTKQSSTLPNRAFVARFSRRFNRERERERERVEKTERAEKKLQFFADQPRLCGSEARVEAAPFAMISSPCLEISTVGWRYIGESSPLCFHANNAAFGLKNVSSRG